MNISRFLFGAFIFCALPQLCLAQPEERPDPNALPFPKVSPEQAVPMVLQGEPISLHLKDVTLKQALDELSQQSGVKLRTDWGGDTLNKKVTVDVESPYFREAFRALLSQADVKANLQRFGGEGTWNINFGENDTPDESVTSGQKPFEIRAKRVTSSFSKSIGTGPAAHRDQSSGFSVSLSVTPDERVPTLGTPRLDLTRAEDDKGISLQPQQPNWRPPFSFDSSWWSPELQADLKAPSVGSKKIARLEGTITYVLPTKYEKWEVKDLHNSPNASHDFRTNNETVHITVSNVRLTDKRLQMDIEAKSLNAPARGNGVSPALFSSGTIIPSITIKTADGGGFVSSGYSANGGNNQLTIQATFYWTPTGARNDFPQNGAQGAQPQGPFTFSLNAPVEFVQCQVPFSFSNLPIP